jgi:putative transposase
VSAFIDERRGDFGVELICSTLEVSASAYYQRKTGQRSARVVEDERLLGVIRRVHAANYEAYGSRRMWKALRREGEDVGRGHVERLMAAHAICGAKRRGKPWRTTIAANEPVASPDLLNRDFTAAAPNLAWVADFTYIRCWKGVVFFSFVLDVYSRMTVGWQFAGHMRTELVQDALDMAVAARDVDPSGVLIHHSDHGSQYTSVDFTDALVDYGLLASLGSVGDAYDNAMAESFVDTFKTELVADRVWRSRSELELAIVEWVGWYNRRRLHSSLGDVPPSEFEAPRDYAITGTLDLFSSFDLIS